MFPSTLKRSPQSSLIPSEYSERTPKGDESIRPCDSAGKAPGEHGLSEGNQGPALDPLFLHCPSKHCNGMQIVDSGQLLCPEYHSYSLYVPRSERSCEE